MPEFGGEVVIPTDPAVFAEKLAALEESFAQQKPEFELVVRDENLGLEGYVVVWNTVGDDEHPACGKGGTRITPDVSLEEIRDLARTMAIKNALAGLALGGAKSGQRGDPDEPDFEAKYRRFIQLTMFALAQNGGPFGGYGFDVGARPEHALWAIDELGPDRLQSFTGKPLEYGGTDYDKEGIAGLGVSVAARTAIEHAGLDITKTTAAVQGIGAMGGAIVRYYHGFGGMITSITDPRIGGTFEVPGGISDQEAEAIGNGDLDRVKELLAERGLKPRPVEDGLYAEVDVLFIATPGKVIEAENQDRIRAKIIAEGTNGPMDNDTRLSLFERGVRVIVDFIDNSGGVIAADVERTSNVPPEVNAQTRANVIEAKRRTEEIIARNVNQMLGAAAILGVAPHLVARYMALTRLLQSKTV